MEKNGKWNETMILKEYTPARAEYLQKLPFSFRPQEIDVLWFTLLTAENIRKNTCHENHHHTFYEIHFVYDGMAEYQCGESSVRLQKNQALFLSPGTIHRYIDSDDAVCKASLAFSAEPGLLLEEHPQKLEYPKDVNAMTDAILAVSDPANPLSEVIITGRLYEILSAVFKRLQIVLPCAEKTENDARVRVAKNFIRENLHRNIKTGDVAKECYLSTKQLGRVFQKKTGCSVFSYITEQRIACSKKLLRKGKNSIKEISQMTGFESAAGFTAFFKRHTGISPGAYRDSL